MILALKDIGRIESLGFKLESFTEWDGVFYRLKNINGHCVFYDEAKGKCLIYSYRPVGCQLYPLVFDEEKGVIMDSDCPLVEEFLSRREEVVQAVKLLEEFLKGIERDYNYKINWRLFEESLRRGWKP